MRGDTPPDRKTTDWRARGAAWLASPRRVLGTLAGFVLIWYVGLSWGVPQWIRLLHRTDVPVLGRLMSGRVTQPIEAYLALWAPIARPLVVLGLTSALVLAALYLLHWYKRQWLAAPPHDKNARVSAGQLLLVAAWIGLAVGLGVAYYLVLRTSYLNLPVPRFLNASQHAVWMSPLASLLVFLLVGLALVLVNRLTGHRMAPGTIITALAGLGLFGLVMATSRLHWAAATVLDIAHVPAGGIPGASLAQYWSVGGPDPVDTVAVAHDGSMASMVTPTHHLLRYRDGRERLFAYRQDPREQADLADDPAMADLLATKRATLKSRLSLDWERVITRSGTPLGPPRFPPHGAP